MSKLTLKMNKSIRLQINSYRKKERKRKRRERGKITMPFN
jgi:hypothetical protein